MDHEIHIKFPTIHGLWTEWGIDNILFKSSLASCLLFSLRQCSQGLMQNKIALLPTTAPFT